MAEAPPPKPQPKQYPGVDQTGIALRPRNFQELWTFSQMISETEFVPLSFRGKPGAVIAACQLGNEVGLPPMTSLRWIVVINGTPSIWGDGYWMLVNTNPAFEWARELGPEEALAKRYGECTIKRKDRPEPITRRYTVEMATQARLWGGRGDTQEKREKSPWFTNPGRMLQMRARALCGRDTMPEATGPLSMREEVEDYATDITPESQTFEPPIPAPQPQDRQPEDRQPDTEPSEPRDSRPENDILSPSPGRDNQSSEPVRSQQEEESLTEVALRLVAGFTKDTFPPQSWLNPYMKGTAPADRTKIIDAYNAKKKELGLAPADTLL